MRNATYVAEELERTLGLVQKGYFPECKRQGLLVDLLEIIARNARNTEMDMKMVTGTDYPWTYQDENGGTICTDKISLDWGFKLLGRGDS